MIQTDVVPVVPGEAQAAIMKIGIAGSGWAVTEVTLNEYVALATLVFVVFQTVLLIPKLIAMFKGFIKWIKK